MHLIATGDDAEPFVEDKEELHMVDDCMHYVFTNAKGPIIVKNIDLSFLTDENVDEYQPESFLSKEATDNLKVLLRINI